MATPRELALFSAKISEQAERYQDMVNEMRVIASMAGEQELSVEERNLLSVGKQRAGRVRMDGVVVGLAQQLPHALPFTYSSFECCLCFAHAVRLALC
jgi:hypothetical protein